jgi:hypothetical protein
LGLRKTEEESDNLLNGVELKVKDVMVNDILQMSAASSAPTTQRH